MPDYRTLIERIARQTGTTFRRASKSNLSELRSLRVPEAVIEFYAQHEPSTCAEGQARLWPIEDMLEENRNMIPGAYISPHGYIVFATTFCGDAYCFDASKLEHHDDPPIVLVSHEVISEGITAEEAERKAKPIARNLYEFLEKLERVELDEDCIY